MDMLRSSALAFGAAALSIGGTALAQAGPDPGAGRGLRIQETSPWAFQVSGVVSHFKEPTCQDCRYRTGVPGIGLQREFVPVADSPLRLSLAGGLQSDSFGESGGYAAAVASVLWRGESVLVRPGIGGFAFYRYMGEGGDRTAAGRELVPALLPVLSIEGVRSGVGATVLVAPNFSYAGRDRSGFVSLHLTYRFGGGRSAAAGFAPGRADRVAATGPTEGLPAM